MGHGTDACVLADAPETSNLVTIHRLVWRRLYNLAFTRFQELTSRVRILRWCSKTPVRRSKSTLIRARGLAVIAVTTVTYANDAPDGEP